MTDAATEAVTALIQQIIKRKPNQKEAILGCTDSYVRVLRGAAARPMLTADQIREVGIEVLDGWQKATFPQPGDFASAVGSRRKATEAAKARPQKSRQVKIAEAVEAGGMAWRWQHNPVNGPAWERDYREMFRGLDDQAQLEVKHLVAAKINRWQAQGIEPLPSQCTDRLRGSGTFKSLSEAIGGRQKMQDAAE